MIFSYLSKQKRDLCGILTECSFIAGKQYVEEEITDEMLFTGRTHKAAIKFIF